MIDNYIFNGKLFFYNDNLSEFYKNNLGIKKLFLKKYNERFDYLFIENLSSSEIFEKELFFNYIYSIIPINSNIIKKKLFNILMLDNLSTYKGFRHYRGLPTRGQRTWSNGWSPYKSNNILRQFRLKVCRLSYNNAPLKESNIAYSAEYINLMWKTQWLNEWLSAKISRLKFKGHPNSMKIDLYSMANYQIMHPMKLKNLSKKQKQSFKKNYFSLGFEIGFTKYLIQNIFHTGSDNTDYNLSKSSVVLRDERLNRKKKIVKKIEKKKPAEKKKKKSVWD